MIYSSTFDTADLPEGEVDDVSAPKCLEGRKHCAVISCLNVLCCILFYFTFFLHHSPH